MDTAATLAFFQNFYTGSALYVVPEREPAAANGTGAAEPVAAAPETSRPVAAGAVGSRTNSSIPEAPATVPVPVAAPQPAPAPPPVAAVPTVSAPLPPAPNPVTSEPPAAPVPPTPAAAPAQPLGTLPLAQLPAAAPAPAGRVQPTPTQSPVAHIPFATLGSNAQGLVILVRTSPEQFRKLPRNVFLNNLLKALRLVMEDVVLVNVEHEKFPVALCSLRQHLAARQFLAFGKNLLDVAVYTTQPYEPVLLYGDTAFLGAGEIEMLEYDAGRKKQLWQAVQRMFLG